MRAPSYRMKKMGWSEEKGLGKNEDGSVEAIKVKRRDQGMALGVSLQDYREAGWNSTAVGFSQVLTLLQQEYKNTSDNDSEGTAGGDRKKGKKKKKAKKEKKEKKDKKDKKDKKRDVPIIKVGMK